MPGWVVLFGAIMLVSALIAGGVIGLRRLQMQRLKQAWQAAKRRIRFGPIGSSMTTLRPRKKDSTGVMFGALGIVDDRLTYNGTFGSLYDIAVPLDQIHWIGVQRVNPSRNISRTVVHFEGPGGWQVYSFHLRAWRAFADTLSVATGLPLVEARTLFDELRGVQPTQVTRMVQNVYGQWQPDFSDTLYLAPDRLLFGWQTSILLADIRQIDLYDRVGFLDAINPFVPDLLRITWERDGVTEVTAYQFVVARMWGQALADGCGLPLHVHEGRKKKSQAGHPADSDADAWETENEENEDLTPFASDSAPDSEQRRRA